MTVPTDVVLMGLAREVGLRLHAAQRVLATAESCTGGWIDKLCNDIAGSSEWFDCGFVCYSNAAKTALPDASTPERARLLLGAHHAKWVQWRCDVFTDWVREFRAYVREAAATGVWHPSLAHESAA